MHLSFDNVNLNHIIICVSAYQDAAVQPALVIVYFGGNDSMGPHSSGLGPHVPLPEYIENLRTIMIHLQVFLHLCDYLSE